MYKVAFAGVCGAEGMQQGSQGSCRQHCPGLLLVHLFHPFLFLPAGLGLIKTMCRESHSHLEGDCSLLLPDCWDWLHYRIILENCFFYESKTYSSHRIRIVWAGRDLQRSYSSTPAFPFSLGCSHPLVPQGKEKKTNNPKCQNPIVVFLLSKVKKIPVHGSIQNGQEYKPLSCYHERLEWNGLKTQTLLCYILPQEKKCAGVFLKDRTSHLSYCCKSNQEGFFFFFFNYSSLLKLCFI